MKPASQSAEFAKTGTDKTGLFPDKTGSNHFALVSKIRGLYPRDTVKILASWLTVSIDTARHRIKGEREFSLDEVVTLLQAEQGFEILSALMTRAKRKPRWWLVCEPLMDLADIEVMAAEVRRRTARAIHNRQEVVDALETEIRRAQTAAIHDPEHTGTHMDALRSMRLTPVRVVASELK